MIVEILAAGRSHQVVLPAPVDLDQAQRRLGPVDPVPALGIAELVGPVVVHEVLAPVQDHGLAESEFAFPGPVSPDHRFRRPGVMEFQPSALQMIDEVIVDEQLQTVSHLDQDRTIQPGGSAGGGFRGRQECN